MEEKYCFTKNYEKRLQNMRGNENEKNTTKYFHGIKRA